MKLSLTLYTSILIVFLLMPINSFSQSTHNIQFEVLEFEDSLKDAQVNGITQDDFGNMWFINNEGLHKYDGVELTNYTNVVYQGNDYSLIGVLRQVIAKDKYVYSLTRKGIIAFNIESETFKIFPINNCNDMLFNKDDLWIATATEILDLNNGQVLEIPYNNGEAISEIELIDGVIYIGTNQRVFAYSMEHKKVMMVKENVTVETLFVDSKGALWFSDKGKGIYSYKFDKQLLFLGPDKIAPTEVRCFLEDDHNNIWIGTYAGIYVIDSQFNIKHYTDENTSSRSLSHDSVLSLFKDKNGLILVGTFYGGINYYDPNALFRYYPESIDQKDGLTFRVVSEMVEDNDGGVWICTEGGGLNYLDRKENKMHAFETPALDDGLVHSSFKSIYFDQKETLWIGSIRGGLFEFNIKTKTFNNYAEKYNDDILINANKINDIVNYGQQLYLSTQNSIEVFDLKTKKRKSLFSNSYKKEHNIPNYTTCLLIKDDVLWIGSTIGLYAYNLKTSKIKSYYANNSNNFSNSIVSNVINDLFEDSKGNLWIATDKGLNLMDVEAGEFSLYKNTDELNRNVVRAIDELNPGFLIISTMRGISILRLNDNTFKNYNKSTGFPLSVLSAKSIFVSKKRNDVFIGGLDGMVSFNSNEIFKSTNLPKPKLTKLSVNNQVVSPDNHSSILKKAFTITDSINLKPGHKAFQISFASDGSIIDQTGNFKIRLLGFEENWREPDGNTVSYTNLDVGDYVFQIENIDNSSLRRELFIKVSPSIFNTVWAYLIYFLIIFSLIIFFNHLILSKRRLQYKVELKEIEQERATEHNKSKLRFFTNISHEFRTPLTLISGHVEALMGSNKLTNNDYKKVLGINKNTNRLNRLALELLQFRKQEAGEYRIEARTHDVVVFLEEIYYAFYELSKRKNIDYKINYETKPINAWFDRLQLEKVFYNLLSNAFKFTSNGGQIVVSIIEKNNTVNIEVRDNGNGMSPEQLSKIFDRFHQLDNIASTIHEGTGIGLALTKGIIDAHHGEIKVKSKLNKGTVFKVKLPLGNKHFNSGEIILEKPPVEAVVYEPYEHEDMHEPQEGKKDKLLVVEDNEEVRSMLKEFLDIHFIVELAKDGKEGLEKALKIQPTLILSDIMMPKMSGTEMCTKLKTNINTSHIPIILLTAKTAEEHMISGLDIGADDYITKPFNSRVLIARINNVINNRKKLKSIFSKNPLENIKKVAKNKIDQEFIEKAEKTILDNLDNNQYDVSKMGVDLNLGRTILYAKMKSITGKTPNDFIKVIRLEKSKQLLNEYPDITISQVAYDCGFSSQQYFSKLFKQQYGVSPKKYQSK